MFVEQHGMAKMAKMLKSWGNGVRSDDVLEQVLGQDPETLDKAYRDYVAKGLERYRSQFVPMLRVEPLDKLELEIEGSPEEPKLLLRFAVSAWRQGRVDEATAALGKVLEKSPKLPDAVYLAGRLAIEGENAGEAEKRARELVSLGHDGYWTQLLLAESLLAQDKLEPADKALDTCIKFDPTQAEALSLKYKLARARKDPKTERGTLLALARLEQHSGALYARLLELMNEAGDYQETAQWAQAALWSDLSNFRIHSALAMAFDKTGARDKATFEWESAALCDAAGQEKAKAHLELIRRYRRAGQHKQMLEQVKLLKALDPQNAELRALGL
jgi:tetratricopeptide (TPR) repeat protein